MINEVRVKELEEEVFKVNDFSITEEFLLGLNADYNVTQIKLLLGLFAYAQKESKLNFVLSFELLFALAGKTLKDRPSKMAIFLKEFFELNQNKIRKISYNQDNEQEVREFFIFESFEIDKSAKEVEFSFSGNELIREMLFADKRKTRTYVPVRLDIIHSLKATSQIIVYLHIERMNNKKINRISIEKMREYLGDDKEKDDFIYWDFSLRKLLGRLTPRLDPYITFSFAPKYKKGKIKEVEFSIKKKE